MHASHVSIESVETILVDVPTIRPHRLSVATMNCQTLVLVRIRCADGIVGVGEGTTIGGLAYGEESPESIKVNIDTYFAPLAQRHGRNAAGRGDGEAARAVSGQPFCQIRGGNRVCSTHRRSASACRCRSCSAAACAIRWTWRGPSRAAIRHAISTKPSACSRTKRHRVFKLKIGSRALADDVAHVVAIRKRSEDRGEVRVDVNQAWSESEAIWAAKRFADAGVALIEQPIAAENRAGLKRLTDLAQVPIMADEALHGPADAFAWPARAPPMCSP